MGREFGGRQETLLVRSPMFDFWQTLMDLVCFRDVVRNRLDVPLEFAIPRSRWAAGWTAAVAMLAAWIRWPDALSLVVDPLQVPAAFRPVLAAAAFVVAVALSVPLAYGFLRLYTLVHHVMVMNVFKCRRGQRLRLLNFYSSTLPLVVPVAMGVDISTVSRAVGGALVCATAAYYLYLTAVAYNRIFHRRQLGGLGLWLGGTLVTWFVLFIGALGIAVALAVIAFFCLAVMRVFTHR
jgi:hypothetical protein